MPRNHISYAPEPYSLCHVKVFFCDGKQAFYAEELTSFAYKSDLLMTINIVL